MNFYAMIGDVCYEKTEASNEFEAYRKITISMMERGAHGLWVRWKASGAKVARFIRQTPDKEFEARV